MHRRRILPALITALLLAVSVPSWGQPPRLSDHQIRLLAYAWHVGEQYNLSLAMAGILMQESLAGILSPVGDRDFALGARAYGVMQVRLPAAQDAIRHCPELGQYTVGEEIIARLITDDYWNIEVAGCYLNKLQTRGINEWRQVLTAYNRGLQGSRRVDPNYTSYALAVVEWVTDGVVGHYQDEIMLVARFLYGTNRRGHNSGSNALDAKNLSALQPIRWNPAPPQPRLLETDPTAYCVVPQRTHPPEEIFQTAAIPADFH